MQYEVKSLGIWSVAKISFVLGGLLGFLLGVIFWLITTAMQSMPLEELSGGMGSLSGLGGAGIYTPFLIAVFYAVVSMIGNAIMAGIYNLLAGMLGGVEITLAARPAYYGPAAAWPGAPGAPPPPQTPAAPGTSGPPP